MKREKEIKEFVKDRYAAAKRMGKGGRVTGVEKRMIYDLQ